VCGAQLDERWATATDTEYGATDERFSYYLCGDCEALSIHPLPQGPLSDIYPPTYYSFASGGADEDPGLVLRVKEWLDLRNYRKALGLLDTESPSVLDVGGGTGEVSSIFVRHGASGTVVDPDATSIEVAQKRGLEGFVGRIEDFETDRRFDLVLMLNLIEHVDDPIGVLRRAGELVSPGGLVWLQTPNFRALDGRIYRHRNWAGYHCPRHWAIFSEAGLRRALARTGLEPADFQRTQGGGFWAQSLLGLRRDRRARRGEPIGAGSDKGLPKPLIRYRGFAPLAALGTAFDMATRSVRQVSQVVVLARAER
jgi:SAM-dependent methyltransferase